MNDQARQFGDVLRKLVQRSQSVSRVDLHLVLLDAQDTLRYVHLHPDCLTEGEPGDA